MNTESVVYLARKLHWTREQIGALSPAQFNEILNEVYFQESVEDYHRQHSTACLLAAIYNTIPRKTNKALTAKDFIKGEAPTRDPRTLENTAEKHNVKLPSKELKNR
mgnify:CR=1 FL=1